MPNIRIKLQQGIKKTEHAKYMREYRKKMTETARQKNREQGRLRMKKYRERQKAKKENITVPNGHFTRQDAKKR